MDIAQLGIQIDSSQAASASVNLNKLAAAAGDAETATGGMGKATDAAGEQLEEFTQHARNHVLSLLDVSEGTRAYIAIAAHVAPVVLLAAAAFSVYETAAKQSAALQDGFASSIAESNDAAGATVGILAQYADQIGRASGSTVAASQVLASLVSTGKVAASNLVAVGQAALDANKAFGTSFDDISKNFAALADSPIATLRSLNALTPALQAQLELLESQGDTVGATTVAQKAYAAQLEEQVQTFSEYESTFTKSWKAIGEAASKAWEDMLGPSSSNLQAHLDALVKARGDRPLGTVQEDAAPSTGGGPEGLAEFMHPTQSADTQRANDADEQRLRQQIASQNAQAAQQKVAATAKLQADKADAVGQVNNAAAITLGNIQLQGSIQSVTDALAKHSQAVESDNSVLESLHSEGLISDTQYYDTRRALIQSDTAAQVAALNQQIALVQRQNALDDQNRDTAILKSKDADNTPQGAANTASLQAQKAEADAQSALRVAQLQQQAQEKQIAGATQIVGINVDQAESYKRVQQQIAQNIATGQLYVKGLTDQYAIQEAGIGLSDQQAQRLTELTNIQQHFAEQVNDIQRQQARGTIGPDQATAEITGQNAALAKATQAFQDHYKAIDAAQGDWLNGAKKAFQDYADAGANVAGLAATAFTTGFNDINTSLVNLVTTGKLNWKSLMTSLITDFVKFEATILESSALQEIGSLFGLSGGLSVSASAALGQSAAAGATSALDGALTFAATGANAASGQPFVVGEQGPELFVPSSAGKIVPNGKWGAGGSSAPIVFNYEIALTSPQVSKNDVLAAMQQTQNSTISKLSDMKRRGSF